MQPSDPSEARNESDDAPRAQRPRPRLSELTASDTPGAWVDPLDVADRQAWRRDVEGGGYERPPHW